MISSKQLSYFRTLPGRAVLGLAGLICALPGHAAPIITSVSTIFTPQIQPITLTGSGFGTLAPYTGDSSNIYFDDVTKSWSAGFVGTLNGSTFSDSVTLVVQSWTDSSIVGGSRLAGDVIVAANTTALSVRQ